MSITPSHEEPQGGATDSDSVTFSFADPGTSIYGLARLGLSGAGEERRGSALALLFAGREPVCAVAEGDLTVATGADWTHLTLPGLAASVDAPLERWSVRMAGARAGFALAFEAISPPAGRVPADGMAGYEQLCRVAGEAVVDGDARPIDGMGQRGHAWGAPDWRRLASVHTVAAWIDGGVGIALTAARDAGAPGHGDDARWAALLDADGAVDIAEPRMSTTYDGEGRQRRAGLELWVGDEDEYPRRVAGHVLCGSTLELGQLRLDCAFMRWTMDGAPGVGRYDVLRRAAG